MEIELQTAFTKRQQIGRLFIFLLSVLLIIQLWMKNHEH